MKFQVAIIGSPGSGKTVLTAVLSRYLSGHSDRVYMNPRGAYKYVGDNTETISTISYISQTLEKLHSGQWETTGTAGNTKYELGFELHIDGNVYDMKLLDSAGEDLQRIGTTYDRAQLNEFQKKLLDYIVSSNVVVLIVNLDHFANAPTLTVKNDNENVLNEVVNNLIKAGTCHYILVCFTAYDKYKAHIDDKYRHVNENNGETTRFIEYLKDELPMFYRSCEVACNTVVRDYTEYDFGQKTILVDSMPAAPVIAQRPAPGINPDRFGKPPIGFDVRNRRHSWGIPQMADWLYKCEQLEREWNDVEEAVKNAKRRGKILSYWIAPIVIGAVCGVLVCLLLSPLLLSCIMFGIPIGAGIGFLVGDKLHVLITKNDGLVFKKSSSGEVEEQEETATSHTAYTGRSSTTPPHPSGTGGTSTAPPHPSGTGGTSAPPPRSSGSGGAGASAGSETFD